MRYQCNKCYTIVDKCPCPVCGNDNLDVMCPNDPGVCTCVVDAHNSIALCPVCYEPMCPECRSHNVFALSRITGYYSNVKSWNNSKRAELFARQRYNLNNME